MRTKYDKDGPQWDQMLGETTEQILEVCHDFAKQAVLSARFSIMLGKHNFTLV